MFSPRVLSKKNWFCWENPHSSRQRSLPPDHHDRLWARLVVLGSNKVKPLCRCESGLTQELLRLTAHGLLICKSRFSTRSNTFTGINRDSLNVKNRMLKLQNTNFAIHLLVGWQNTLRVKYVFATTATTTTTTTRKTTTFLKGTKTSTVKPVNPTSQFPRL